MIPDIFLTGGLQFSLCQEVWTNYLEYDEYCTLPLYFLVHLSLLLCFIYCIFIALHVGYMLYIALWDGLCDLREALYPSLSIYIGYNRG